MTDFVSGTAAAPIPLAPATLFLQADPIVKAIIVILVIASAWSWVVIVDKLVRFRVLWRRANHFVKTIQRSLPITDVAEGFAKASPSDPFVIVYKAMVEEHARSAELIQTESQRDNLQERVHRSAQLAISNALDRLQTRLEDLATIGAVAPFIGLFGTVWGIMNSFQGIAASNNTSLGAVAPGIAEALFATALGLVAAIPAVIFYNRIGTEVRRYGKQLMAFAGVFEIELSRQLSKKEERHGLRVA